MNVDQFVNTYNGRVVDVDGAYGGQCWDLWSRYAQDVCGVPQSATNTMVGSGLADSVYYSTYGRQPQLQAAFSKLGAGESARKGDVAFWADNSAAYPDSHVAIVLEDRGNSLYCLTQNPGATKKALLTKSGLLGYFRPKKDVGGGTTASNGNSASSNPVVVAGNYRCVVDVLNVRDQPTVKGATVAQYKKGQTVNLEGWGVYADGYLWGRYKGGSGKTRYIAIGTQSGEWYLALNK
ncbi:SH3 domain-containing protein [Bifidobacterium eulemuris]|uniref:Amidase n=1 Tax=Bifidobacterium eulemuris TaxID=1765219 RepID=A0A261GA37_9BIFI|nr:SH3 domain-containing protein [Bifidobacterium eulemuris]OZG68292.1 amidase [Bifidobacterium eulemuris]QOL31656.1 SH3 domain-containing protein [Bifidobacterium eulemuris]